MTYRNKVRPLLASVLALALAAPVQAQPRPPLAASDWLGSGTLTPPPREASGWRPGLAIPPDAQAPARPRPRPEGAAESGPVGVSRLGGPDADAIGLAAAADIGLAEDFWAGATLEEAESALAGPAPRLPVLDSAFRHVLTAQLTPPARAEGQEGALYLARIDALMRLGAVDLAAALIDAAAPDSAAVLARRMDAALLAGDERRLCAQLVRQPGLAPSLAARIFCLAQGGDWPTAQLALAAGRLNGAVAPDLLPLLAAFLDDALADDEAALTPPEPMTPLAFRLLEAIGQPLPTTGLPLAYAMADLRANTGWKPRIEAAERLARAGDLDPRHLRAIYSEQPPAASGGVWDRVAAMQRLEAALAQDDPAAIAAQLPPAAAAMRDGGLSAAFAQMFGADLATAHLPGPAGRLAEVLAMAAATPEAQAALASLPPSEDAGQNWLRALALGQPLPLAGTPLDAPGAPLAEALSAPAPTTAAPYGPTFLAALRDVDAGREGDLARAANGIAALRSLGQDALARTAALQLILLPGASVAGE